MSFIVRDHHDHNEPNNISRLRYLRRNRGDSAIPVHIKLFHCSTRLSSISEMVIVCIHYRDLLIPFFQSSFFHFIHFVSCTVPIASSAADRRSAVWYVSMCMSKYLSSLSLCCMHCFTAPLDYIGRHLHSFDVGTHDANRSSSI